MDQYVEKYVQKQLNQVPATLNRNITNKEKNKFNKREEFKKIKQRIDEFINKESDERFFVLPGLRGVGKTTLMYQSYEYLLKEKDISPNNILYVSCDVINKIKDVDIEDIVECYSQLIHHCSTALIDEDVFIFVDEAHYDKNWAGNGKIIFDKCPNIFIIFSGSSSIHLDYNADGARRLKIKTIPPLNYSQHLKLKYDYKTDISKDLINLIFKGEIESAQEKEHQIQNDLINIIDYDLNDWEKYMKYGSFASTLNKKHIEDIEEELWSIISRVITKDIVNVFSLNSNMQENVFRVLTFLASQNPGEISQASIANDINVSKSTVNSIFTILEKTQLIFHYEAYGFGKKPKKAWKYYIATPSLRHCINSKFGIMHVDSNDYNGVLLENLVATGLFNLSNNENFINFSTFYDSQSGGADFIIQKAFEKPIPIEVGLGKKSDRQVKKSMRSCKSDYGILISNKTKNIEKKNDIIYVPPKTFSFL